MSLTILIAGAQAREKHDNPVMARAGSDAAPQGGSWNALVRSAPVHS